VKIFDFKLQALDDQYEKNHNWDIDNGVLNDEESKTKRSSIVVQNSVLMQMKSDVTNEDWEFLPDDTKLVLDYDLIYKLWRFGYSYEYVIGCLKEGVVNYCTATYYLLLQDKY